MKTLALLLLFFLLPLLSLPVPAAGQQDTLSLMGLAADSPESAALSPSEGFPLAAPLPVSCPCTEDMIKLDIK